MGYDEGGRVQAAPGSLYVWLDDDPQSGAPQVIIEDVPGVSDLDLIADAIVTGRLGRYLPVTLAFADHQTPVARRVRSVDVAKLLRDRHIRHRRRYEVILGPDAAGRDSS